MKRLITLGTLLTVLICHQASAQLKKGEKMLGGAIAFSNDEVTFKNDLFFTADENKYTNLSVSPQFGVGVGGNWIIGLSPSYTYSKQKQNNGVNVSDQRSYTATIAAFVRKFHSFGDRFGIFGQLEGGYNFGETRYRISNTPESKYKAKGYGVVLSPGAFYRTGKRFIIEASIGAISYNHMTSTPQQPNGSKVTTDRINASLTNNLSLGFSVVL